MSEPITVDLGAVTAYADAVEQGYTGTREEFGELLANFAKRADEVKQDKEEVKQTKEAVFLKAESFDKHVEEEKTRVTEEFNSNADRVLQTNKQEIGDAKSEALEEIANLKEDAVTQVNKTKTDGVQQITTLTNEKKSLLENTGTNQKNLVESEGTKQIQAVENKGAKTLQTIPEDYTTLNNTVNNLSELMNTKAPAIVEEAKSGTEITVNDSAEMPLQGLNVYGKSKQVTTTGANLFDANDVSKGYISDDSGSNIVVANSYCSNFIAVSAKTKYYLYSGQNDGRWGAFYDSSKTFISGISTDKYNSVFETPENAAYIRFTVDYNNNNPDFARNVIFAKSTVALPFEPYTGGKPSPSPDYPQEIVSVGEKGSIGIEITGKNLFGGKAFANKIVELGGTLVGDNVKIDASKINGKLIYKFTDSSKRYTIIVEGVNSSKIQAVNLSVCYSDGTTGGFGEFANGKRIVVTIKDVIGVYGSWYTGEATYTKFGIFEGEVKESDYEPYKESKAIIPIQGGLPGIPVTAGGNYTDENGQQYICDEIDFGRGKYVQRIWKGVFDGSEDEAWSYNIGAHRANIILNNGNLGTYDQRGIASMCSNLLWNRSVYSDSNRKNGYLINNNSFFVRVAESLALNTEPDFRTWLASNPITLQYVLATPIETDLSEAQIQAYKSLTTFKPASTIRNDEKAWMSASYVADTKLYIDSKIQEVASAIIASASEAE